jgi:hypothetical protein
VVSLPPTSASTPDSVSISRWLRDSSTVDSPSPESAAARTSGRTPDQALTMRSCRSPALGMMRPIRVKSSSASAGVTPAAPGSPS